MSRLRRHALFDMIMIPFKISDPLTFPPSDIFISYPLTFLWIRKWPKPRKRSKSVENKLFDNPRKKALLGKFTMLSQPIDLG